MHLKPHALGLTCALTMGALYILCVAVVAVSPNSALSFFNYFFHGIDLTKIAMTDLVWSSVVVGFVLTLILCYVFAAIFAAVYNKIAK